MASTEGPTRAHDRHGRRRPFSNWMKRLANLKNSNPDAASQDFSAKRSNLYMSSKSKKGNAVKNNPYALCSRPVPSGDGRLSFSTPLSLSESRLSSHGRSAESVHASHDEQNSSRPNAISRPTTLSTTGETAISDAAASKTGTSATAARTDGGGNSTFSSPAPSVRSMTTTLTTLQSVAVPGQGNTIPAQNGSHTTTFNSTNASSHFSHQFPSTSPPATAVPGHLAPHTHPTTYTSATANNMLTDDASILTLASSSKRRRRNSADTNASMRALAPASMFGGSRESLPLSVLSGIADPSAQSVTNAPGTLPRPSIGGIASAERASLYSSSGIAPALTSDRNSYLAGKQAAGDGASVRSGLLAHGRNDSMTNSIGGGPTSPLASAPPVAPTGKISRRSSGWVEVPGDEIEVDKTEETKSEEGIRPR
ncbi:hypothetical protein EPUS_01467 [Endocarpon pusillum Z07020]|uniref:Ca2+-modulated nonselective cation channel polycystin n=1 Tax=Endocarpon pusillum (strain Z07020 / HMAS-L-300199) TaxID=1263415 RepID=U1GUL5_ENDPU|nr:uncharacterized protein EPUS_01467 [Endocarpon pusillum Z07020]ERF76133.1 hypothetical protein EPUS_01467 [Endocarpon pusillum Z07020]